MSLAICKTAAALEEALAPVRARGGRVGLVPTMGALHRGHMALVHALRGQVDAVVVYVFVNPAQFGPNEDFARYPRTLEADIALCEAEGVEAVYAPAVDEVYPTGFATKVSVKGVSELWEGAHRPGHFDGVATVLARMFSLIRPDMAAFGEKDYQQLAVIRTFVRDLHIPVEILGVPTVREPDGLALSSRNRYLNEAERAAAPRLHEALKQAEMRLKQGQGADVALTAARQEVLDAGFAKVDYIALVDARTLEPLARPDRPARLIAAATLGSTRLIDNIPVE